MRKRERVGFENFLNLQFRVGKKKILLTGTRKINKHNTYKIMLIKVVCA